jgi:hypothetical protein
VQAVRRPQVLPLLRERIRQPREAAHAHADRQILAPLHATYRSSPGRGYP